MGRKRYRFSVHNGERISPTSPGVMVVDPRVPQHIMGLDVRHGIYACRGGLNQILATGPLQRGRQKCERGRLHQIAHEWLRHHNQVRATPIMIHNVIREG